MIVQSIPLAPPEARGSERDPRAATAAPDLFELLLGAELAQREVEAETAAAAVPPEPEGEAPPSELLDPRLAIAAHARAAIEDVQRPAPESAPPLAGGIPLADAVASERPKSDAAQLERPAPPSPTDPALSRASLGFASRLADAGARPPTPDPNAAGPSPQPAPDAPRAEASEAAIPRSGAEAASPRGEPLARADLARLVPEPGAARPESSTSTPPSSAVASETENARPASSSETARLPITPPTESQPRAAAPPPESGDRSQAAHSETSRPAGGAAASADARQAGTEDPGRDERQPPPAPDRAWRPLVAEPSAERPRPSEVTFDSVALRTPPSDTGDRSASLASFEAVARPATPAPGASAAVSGNPAPNPTPAAALQEPIEWLLTRGGGSARVTLHPPHLGDVDIRVSLRGGAVHVQVVAHEPAAHGVLDAGRDLLVQNLAARDIRVEGFQVSSPLQGDADDASDSRTGGSGGRSDAEERGASLQGQRTGRFGHGSAGPPAGAGMTAEGTSRPPNGSIDLRI